jgi:hypothetical protein
VPEHLEETHNRQVAHVGQEVGPLLLESVPAEAEDLQIGHVTSQVVNQLSRVEVPGRLSARDEKPRSGRDGHAEAV